MPDEHGNKKTNTETTPKTSRHAYEDGRQEDIKGDVEALKSNDSKQFKQDQIEGGDEVELAHEKG